MEETQIGLVSIVGQLLAFSIIAHYTFYVLCLCAYLCTVQPEDLILNSLHAAAKDGPSMLHMNVTFGFNGGLPITSIFALFVDNSSDHEVSLYIPVRDDTPGSKIIEVHSRNVSALRPGHTYFVTVRASSEAGSTNVSNTIVYTLPCKYTITSYSF